MQYLLMIHANENGLANTPKADLEAMMAAYGAYTQAMKEAGVYRGGERLQPTATATVVRVKDGKTSVLNGPYAEVKEQLGGFFAIEAADLDAAIGWAARCPGAQHGAIEVRPIWPM
ncbi:MAG: YciI family protein [Roseiarcus sp.]